MNDSPTSIRGLNINNLVLTIKIQKLIYWDYIPSKDSEPWGANFISLIEAIVPDDENEFSRFVFQIPK
jgi:hypothetical protein